MIRFFFLSLSLLFSFAVLNVLALGQVTTRSCLWSAHRYLSLRTVPLQAIP